MTDFKVITAENGEKYTAGYIYDCFWSKDLKDFDTKLVNVIIYQRGECIFDLKKIFEQEESKGGQNNG